MQSEKQNIIQVTDIEAAKLKNQALEYQILQVALSQSFQSDANDEFYLLSTKWLNQWKNYVSYDEIVADKPPSEYFGRITPDIINNDLQDNVLINFKYYPLSNHPWNKFIKQGLQEIFDYVVIDKKIWKFFTDSYNGIPINSKLADVNLLRFKSILLYPAIIKQICLGRMQSPTFDNEVMQVDRNMKFKDYQSLIQKTVYTFVGNFAKDSSVRIWRYITDQKDQYQALYDEINKQVCYLESQDEMSFYFNGELLTHQQYDSIKDIGITETHLIVFEFKTEDQPWCIRNQAVQREGECQYCHAYKVLQFPCLCQKVAYCQEECKQKDYKSHLSNCEKLGSDDESVKYLTLAQSSIKGIVGLQNLGNTSFLNSGTQCISNSFPLVEYFLKNLYFDEINLENPIGTRGQLVKKLGSLIKRMWCGDSKMIVPTDYKKAVEQFYPVFSGYHMHDSAELITAILDGIHEDLNRVKKKLQIQNKDYDGRPDFVIAKESWLNHLARNQSIIVDLINGLQKFTLKCPTCQQVSITFQPYLIVELDIPTQKKTTISFKFYEDLFKSTQMTIPFDKNINIPLKEYLKYVGSILKVDSQLFGYIINTDKSYQFLDQNQSIVDIRKRSKKSQLCFRKLTEHEIKMKNQIPIQFENQYFQNSIRKSFDQNGVLICDRQMKLKQVHLLIFNHFNQFFSHHNILGYGVYVLNQYYTLIYRTNQNPQNPCRFCYAQNCDNCEVKFDDETIEQVMNRAFKIDQQVSFKIIILWKQCPLEQVGLSDMFEYYNKLYKLEVQVQNIGNSLINQKSSQRNVTLYDCLQYSQMPQQLNKENTWYCKICKQHVKAFQSVQIYKAPQLLIFKLNRFKANNKIFKQKIEDLVNFPINNLDMTDYVINSNTPNEFLKENESNNGEINKKKVIYDLYAISNHFGGQGEGHYTTYAKNKFTNNWYNFNDSMVNQIMESFVVSESAYVLCYQLRTDEEQQCQKING
ncbi:unnamed protein product (macronuclear) [Paramecium tetraurelia]|uniref:ubiquitinyl hydrolase 1 n=1 Tax=Paramecium tetraurelia TaxID=5888 RepID=A0DC95_PARTE|nr:uncharacterized protein GSPATT00015540001 [Paramecium tetraurelia]CAK80662.1 unnamed protein product [Paramecium tetraurelia]|eukprot:XP_001448059.1 hypothetical protein (macronuclear) [Paramecium tetraurelia strain d4-2]